MIQSNKALAAHPANAFTISRSINAPRDLVWKAYTQREHLLKWFGPKGFQMLDANMDLQPGGIFHYGMKAPDGTVMWGKWIFREINAPQKLTIINAFSNKEGGITRHPFAPLWPLETLATTTFAERDGKR